MNHKFTLSVDLRIVCLALVAVIIIMFGLWQPWDTNTQKRTITITGSGKVTATPDSYQFNPSFQKATTPELNTQVATVTSKLKELGVADKDITVQTSAFSNPVKISIAPAPDQNYSYAYLTISVPTKELAQKIQDYIATTDAQGQLTPYPNFSDDKQKQLKEQARDAAILDAKSQASKTATGIGAKVGKVIELKDNDNNYDILVNEGGQGQKAMPAVSDSNNLPIYPGEQDINVSVRVVFEIK